MASELSKSSESEKKSYQTWSRRITKGDNTEEINVTEAENGYIVCHTKCGYRGKGEDKAYYHDEQKYISKENPLEDEDEEKSFGDELDDIMSELAEQEGMIDVK